MTLPLPKPFLALLIPGLLLGAGCGASQDDSVSSDASAGATVAAQAWTESELALLESLAIEALPPTPAQPSNRVADGHEAAELGHHLFFDPRLSRGDEVSCATCHVPAQLFTDGRATSRGLADTSRNAPTLVGAAHSPWLFWDGRRDSLWSQALGPLETAAEMGTTRTAVVRHVLTEPHLVMLYRRAFGEARGLAEPAELPRQAGPFGDTDERLAWRRLPARSRHAVDRVFADIGKAIAAYERLLQPGPSRFDRYVADLRANRIPITARLSEDEIRGLHLFIDTERTLCLRCHNGPLLTNQSFHNVGTASGTDGLPDFGRFLGVQAVLIDPFNCLGAFSDAHPNQCRELRFLDKTHVGDEMGKFKTPTLRGLARTAPYMHDGRFATLAEVIEHYRSPPTGSASPEITPLEIDEEESRALAAFLATLDGGVDAEQRWLNPPTQASQLSRR